MLCQTNFLVPNRRGQHSAYSADMPVRSRGLAASLVSSGMALLLGIIAGTMGKKVSTLFNWFVDLFMGVPHLVLLILISVLVGKGAKGVAIGNNVRLLIDPFSAQE